MAHVLVTAVFTGIIAADTLPHGTPGRIVREWVSR